METKILVEGKHGNGAVKRRLDIRDRKWKKIAKASIPFDWSTAPNESNNFLPEILKIKDQGQSDSCGGQAGSYLSEILIYHRDGNYVPQSAKSLYSLTAYPGGGTTMRDVLSTICNRGVNLESDIPSYPNTETNLTDKSWVNPINTSEAGTRRGLNYAFVNPDIQSVAQAIRDAKAVIWREEGYNNGTWLSPMPIPPSNSKNLWSHFETGMKPVWYNGKKAIKTPNSWGEDVGIKGYQYITEDYFKSGHIKEVGVIYEPTAPGMTPVQKQQMVSLLQKAIDLCYKILDILKNKGNGTNTQPSMKTSIIKVALSVVAFGLIVFGFYTMFKMQKDINTLGQMETANQQNISVLANFTNTATNGQLEIYVNSLQKK